MARSGSPLLHAILEESLREDNSVSSEGESSGFPIPRVWNVKISIIPIVATPPPEETPEPQTTSARMQRTATPTTLPAQPIAYQEERRRALQDDIKHEAAQRWGEHADERAVIDARLADLHQHESMFVAG
jgi:hypothetical protein